MVVKSMNNNNKIISGTAMAVFLGFISILSALFSQNIDIGSRILLFFIGIVLILLGLRFSRG
jgi:hypothetical protein